MPTSHLIGQKKVLLSNAETISAITQIAISKLFKNDIVEKHVHPTMDEHYVVLSGEGIILVDNTQFNLQSGTFILVPAGSFHEMKAITDLEFITIGVGV